MRERVQDYSFGATLPAMFCPQCRVEYRPGFTHCTDCDVDLVNDYVSGAGYQEVRKRELPYELSAQLWQGADPQFYLTLIDSLANRKVPCFGRPVSPPMYDSFEEQPPGSSSAVEFEVLVSEENLPFAHWVLSSEKEWFKEQQEPSKDFGEGAEEPYVEPDISGICPLCNAQFISTCTTCPNCGVPLRPPQRGALEQNPARVLCDLLHPQFLADLRMALQQAAIPCNNANFPEGPDTLRRNVAVLDSDFERATKVLAQVLQYWEFDRRINLGTAYDPREPYTPHRAKRNGWYPEDLQLLLWTGTNLGVLESIGMALREHEIAYRVECPEPGSAKLFIHPEDEQPAKAVLQDALNGLPPE